MASALKKLLKSRPTTEDITRSTKELFTDSPRAAAVLGSALLEDALRVAILFKLVDLSADENDRLFLGSGPLATFSTKIQIAYAMGIIGPKVRHDLDTIREVRNGFAHLHIKISFDTPEIANSIKGLHCLSVIKPLKESDNYQAAFAWAIDILLTHLISTFATKNEADVPQNIKDLG